MFGDHIPNAKDQIHLDPIDKITIYEEYLQEVDVTHADIDPVGYSKFLEIWKELFPHVSIREFKAVTGDSIHLCFNEFSSLTFRKVFVLLVVEQSAPSMQRSQATKTGRRIASIASQYVYVRAPIVLRENKGSPRQP